jgi:hypothetical protein
MEAHLGPWEPARLQGLQRALQRLIGSILWVPHCPLRASWKPQGRLGGPEWNPMEPVRAPESPCAPQTDNHHARSAVHAAFMEVILGFFGPGRARRSQGEPGGARRSQEETGGARRSQAGGARRSQEEPGGARGSQGEPGGARASQGRQKHPSINSNTRTENTRFMV